MIDFQKLAPKLGKYLVGESNDITDVTLLQRVQRYRRVVGGRMQAMDKPTMERKLPDDSYFLSKKVDGEFNVLVYENERAFLINPGGTIRAGLPLLREIEDTLNSSRRTLRQNRRRRERTCPRGRSDCT
jgi:hypothetical protein